MINTFYVNPLRLTLFSNSPYGIGIRRSRLDPYFFDYKVVELTIFLHKALNSFNCFL